jgi:hypothetical protein
LSCFHIKAPHIAIGPGPHQQDGENPGRDSKAEPFELIDVSSVIVDICNQELFVVVLFRCFCRPNNGEGITGMQRI